ncbi:MAG: S1 RNA-binding domain-containing protein [Clostridia bacterium]|nr:S1 RNA-binding domain-containing protein [Clostridia bacterium]
MDNKITHPYRPEGELMHRAENRINLSSADSLRRCMRAGTVLEAPAVSANTDLALEIDLGASMRGIIPKEEAVLLAEGEKFKEISVIGRVGKAVAFKVIGEEAAKDGRPLFILSRRAAQLECKLNYIDCLEAGDVIDCKITHTERYGAFCDVGCGCFALLPVDRISVSRLPHPRERFASGDLIRAIIKHRDSAGRLFISRRELCGTWEENASLFSVGQTVTGIVRSVESYGAFIELTPNLAGLAEPCNDLEEGQYVAVYIKSIIPEKMKVKLVIIDKCPALSAPRPTPVFPIEEREHVSFWQYNPPSCKKSVETIFDGRP